MLVDQSMIESLPVELEPSVFSADDLNKTCTCISLEQDVLRCALRQDDSVIDLVYNRLTDFLLDAPP